MDKSETLDLGISDSGTENKKTLWITVAIIVVVIIIVLAVSLAIGFSDDNNKKSPNGMPTQKSVNLLDENISTKGGTVSQQVGLTPLKSECYENSWQTATGENYRQVAKLANVKWYNTESASAIPSDVRGMSFIREGYQADPFEKVTADIIASAREAEAAAAADEIARARKAAAADAAGTGVTSVSSSPVYKSGAVVAKGGPVKASTRVDVVRKYEPVSASASAATGTGVVGAPTPVDPVGKSAIANAKAEADAVAAAVAMDTKQEVSIGSKAVRASMPPGYKRGDVVAKGGLMETSTPIPVVVVDGKEVLVPGITGLDYYDHFASTALTGGSVDRYARDRDVVGSRGKRYPLTGSYNSKSYYGVNPYKKGVDQVISFGNTPVGYSDTSVSVYNTDGNIDGNSGNGPVTNADYERVAEACRSRGLTGNSLQECQTDGGMAGVNTEYTKNDLVTSFRGYEDSFLLADGIDVKGSISHQIAISTTIGEEAEIEYKEDVKRNASTMANSDVCDPLVIYAQTIGLVEDEDDVTTPENYRVNTGR